MHRTARETRTSGATEPARAVSLSAVVPAYNEQELIAECVLRLDEVLRRTVQDYEIIVVDDGSTDGTQQALAELAPQRPRLVILRNHRNRGLGSALRKGFRRASHELVLYTDADMPVDFGEIPRAVSRLRRDELDLLIGRRRSRSPERAIRTVYSAVYNALIRAVFSVPVRDVNFAFKLIRRETLDALALRSEGSFIDAELVVKAISQGHRWAELFVEARARTAGTSKGAGWPIIAKILLELVQSYPAMASSRRKRAQAPDRNGR